MNSKGIDSIFGRSLWVGLGAGLYPLLHYYNSNFDLADSWVQFIFLLAISLILPQVLLLVSPWIFRLQWLRKYEKYRKTAINLIVFLGLFGLLIFLFKKKAMAVTFAAAGLLSFIVYKHLAKIVLLQLLLALMSFVTLVPKLFFMLNYSTEWTKQPDGIEEIAFKKSPNIYLIQPDGYSSFDFLEKQPYNYPNTDFKDELSRRGFTHYGNFRSNYYSTLTSNASLFTMKHHYYENTYPGNLKTYGAQEAIVGDASTVLNILKKNDYKTHLFTDNSYFLVNRKRTNFDYCNVPQERVLLWDTGGIYGIDIVDDFAESMQTVSKSHNFIFIEKTLPSHINYGKSATLGIIGERERYVKRLQEADVWITALIDEIAQHDPDGLVIIAADHGGYVGLEYVKEVETRALSAVETYSVFNSLLTIKWPGNMNVPDWEIDSSVNLFRQIFTFMAEDNSLLEHLEPDASFLPRYEDGNAKFYKCLNDTYEVVNEPFTK